MRERDFRYLIGNYIQFIFMGMRLNANYRHKSCSQDTRSECKFATIGNAGEVELIGETVSHNVYAILRCASFYRTAHMLRIVMSPFYCVSDIEKDRVEISV